MIIYTVVLTAIMLSQHSLARSHVASGLTCHNSTGELKTLLEVILTQSELAVSVTFSLLIIGSKKL